LSTQAKTDQGKERTRLQLSPPDRIAAWHAAEDADRLRRQLQQWFAFYDDTIHGYVWRPSLTKSGSGIKDYTAFLREKVAGIAPDDKSTVIGVPVGRAALMAQLDDEMIPYTPEELIAMAGSRWHGASRR